jgi:hypothetical protein
VTGRAVNASATGEDACALRRDRPVRVAR